jgi:hypothetical protein
MNNFKNFLKDSSIEPAKLSSGKFSIGEKFRLLSEIKGTEYKKDQVFTTTDNDDLSKIIKLGGIGEYSFFDENNIKITLHAGPQIIDGLFEHIHIPKPIVEKPLAESPQIIKEVIIREPQVIERIIEKVIVEKPVRGPMGPEGPQGPKGDPTTIINIDGGREDMFNIDGGREDEIYGGTETYDGGWI